jgi:DNA-binding transcriptional LysR family regulator
MNLDLLNTFIIFVESKNIFEAAEKLGISQPSVSLHLKQLQTNFKKDLFTTKGKKKVLTPFGRAMYESVSVKISELRSSVERTAKSFEDYKDITIKIACRRELVTLISQKVSFPGRIEFIPSNSKNAARMVLANEVDFAITHVKPDSLEISASPFFEEESHFLVHKDLVKKKSLDRFKDPDFLKEAPFLAYNRKLVLMKDWLQKNKIGSIDLNIKFMIDDWNDLTKLILAHKAYTICPASFVVDSKDILAIPVPSKIVPKRKFYILQKLDSKKIFPRNDIFSL